MVKYHMNANLFNIQYTLHTITFQKFPIETPHYSLTKK